MKAQAKKSQAPIRPQRPWNPAGYRGGPLPPGPIKVPRAPAADVPREPKDLSK
jgi:hypothetical protein